MSGFMIDPENKLSVIYFKCWYFSPTCNFHFLLPILWWVSSTLLFVFFSNVIGFAKICVLGMSLYLGNTRGLLSSYSNFFVILVDYLNLRVWCVFVCLCAFLLFNLFLVSGLFNFMRICVFFFPSTTLFLFWSCLCAMVV